MKIKRKLSSFFLTLFSLLVASLFPIIYIYTKIVSDNLNVMPTINFNFMIYFGISIVLGILAFVYIKWFRVIWHRKLQAIATVKEFETIPDKAPVLTRILRSTEYSYPLLILLMLSNSLTFLSSSFIQIRDIFIFVNIGMVAMFVILLLRDIIDNGFRNKIRIAGMEKDELKQEKLYLKRLEKGKNDEGVVSRKNRKLLEIKSKIKEIEYNNM